MGCNVSCPYICRSFDDNWELDDPTGKSDDEFRMIISKIEARILKLREDNYVI
jgi:arsenate reductase